MTDVLKFPDPNAPILTTREAAELLRTSVKQVRRLPIPKVRLGKRRIVYRREDLLDYVRRLAHPEHAA